jgi:hypothetical protein
VIRADIKDQIAVSKSCQELSIEGQLPTAFVDHALVEDSPIEVVEA